MDIQEYISSGIIESYVLGLAGDAERKEFEHLCTQFPELIKAREAFELSLEKEAMKATLRPSATVKENILKEISNPSKLVPIKGGNRKQSLIWKYAAAAAILLLIGSIAWNISIMSRNHDLAENLNKAQESIDGLMAEIGNLQQNPNIKMAALRGMDISPQSSATVYWDTASHDVFLLANNLPAPPTDKHYQLWALLDGKPVDLGMMDYDIRQKKLLVRMKNAQNAQAFAITLERKDRKDASKPGGEMYVMGNL